MRVAVGMECHGDRRTIQAPTRITKDLIELKVSEKKWI